MSSDYLTKLQELNHTFSNRIRTGSYTQATDTVLSGASERLGFFVEHMKSGEPITVTFNTGLADGTLQYINEQGIRIVMPRPDVVRTTRQIFNHRGNGIGANKSVIIVSVDTSSKTVTVKDMDGSEEAIKEEQNKLNDAIGQALRNHGNEPVIVTGRIFHVNERRALVDLFDKQVVGVIDVANWSSGYTRNFQADVRKGEWYEFEVTGRNRFSRRDTQWVLSRKNIAVDPWSMVPEDISTPGNTIVVKCVQKDLDHGRWWGTVDRLYDIEVMGSFNDSVGVIKDCSYKCKVRRFDKDAHVFLVVPFAFADSEGGFGSITSPAETASANDVPADSVPADSVTADGVAEDGDASLFADSGASTVTAAD